MNDDIEGAETRLRERKESSAFHQLGLGISTFLSSILGFEKDIMAEATARLLECETRSWTEMKKAQKDAGRDPSRRLPALVAGQAAPVYQVYPAGSEYALVHAEAQLMLAVIAVLHESLTESIKGFYKLRKAFMALNAIMESETALLSQRRGTPDNKAGRVSLSDEKMPGTFDDNEFTFVNAGSTPSESRSGSSTRASTPSHAKLAPTSDKSPSIPVVSALSADTDEKVPKEPKEPKEPQQPSSDDFTHPVDIFVHSGSNMCFGILLLLISMVPPAFSRLLYVIGFKGDRDRGVRMLWQSTKFPNINGGVAGLVLLAYYNGSIGYCDIVPTEADAKELSGPGEIVGYPRERCRELLAHMRVLYPDSMLWRLEEARALTTSRKIEEAIQILTSGDTGRMRQITALSSFELALDAMCIMDWRLMSNTFLQCMELNDWSHALYYYNAGCAELELYRDAFHRAAALANEASAAGKVGKAEAETAAAKHKKMAEGYFRRAPTLAGRKKFMARQMPFEAFVIRKICKWEERAKTLNLDLADAVGVSPAQEMIYLWNGSKRMPVKFLEKALENSAWERCTAPPPAVETFQSTLDEKTIGSLCRAALLRSLGRTEEARALLEQDILIQDRAAFKGPLKDDYIPAAAQYETAAIAWQEASEPALHLSNPSEAEIEAFRRKRVEECEAALKRLVQWESYLLDARIGMKVQTGLDTVGWLKNKKNWS